MALRLLELTAPEVELERLDELLREQPLHHVWTEPRPNRAGLVRILVDAENVEALTDALVGRLGSRDDFRMILLPVEATLPRVAETRAETDARETQTEVVENSHRVSREELYEDIAQGARLTAIYAAMVALSAVVAAVGLLRGDVAIIIGAMVIAPLLGPNIAVSLGCTLGDLDLVKRALRVLGAGLAIGAAVSFAYGVVLGVDPAAPQLAARSGPDVGDIMLALAAGTAGSLAFTSGVSSTLVGVMVAVALLPPLVTAGLLFSVGAWTPAFRAALLLVTNVTCISLASVATFLLQKVRPRTWWEGRRATRATRIAVSSWVALLVILLVVMLLWRVEPV